MSNDTHPAAEPVDFFTWNRAFHGIRPRDTDDTRPVKLNAASHAVACAIAAHINRTTGRASLGIRRIAESAQVSTSTARVAVESVEAAGWFKVTRTARPGTKANATSVYELAIPTAAAPAAPVDESSADSVEVPPNASEVYRESLHPVAGIATPCSGNRYKTTFLTSLTTSRDEKTSPIADASAPASVDKSIEWKRRAGEHTAEPMPLHPEWTPNNANRSTAATLGLNVDVEAEVLRTLVDRNGGTSRNWGKVFAAYLRCVADGNLAEVFRWDTDTIDEVRGEVVANYAIRATSAALSDAQAAEDALMAPETPERDDDAPTALSEANEVIDAEPVEDTGRRWTYRSEHTDTPPPVDVEADRAEIAALIAAHEAPRTAEIEAQRRQQIARKVAAALALRTRRKLRTSETTRITRMIDEGARVDAIISAILDDRHAARAVALAELSAAPVPA